MRPQYLTRAQLPKTSRGKALRGPRADIWPENDYHAGATVVIDDPREPVIQPIGLLDASGEELLKVTMPIKVPMGFVIPTAQDHDDCDEVVQIVPESMLMVSDVGLGRGYVTPAEADSGYEDDEEEGDGDGDAPEAGFTQVTVRIPATPEVVAAHTALGEATEIVGDQVSQMHLDLTPEGIVVLRGLMVAQTEALVAFLVTCHAARAAKDGDDEQT